SILRYVRETAQEAGIDRHIRFNHRVLRATWSTPDARWTVHAERTDTGEAVELTCSFLFGCTGYYRYDEGYRPTFAGAERFHGPIVHPQHWDEALDYDGKRVVVIGSGATAVTLIPAMARETEHITMLQRSPSYVMPLPQKDPIANGLRRVLPDKLAYRLTRRLNVGRQRLIYDLSKRHPAMMRRLIRALTKHQLPEGFPVDVHFKPRYHPWDERLCVVPDGDLFREIRAGRASVVTD